MKNRRLKRYYKLSSCSEYSSNEDTKQDSIYVDFDNRILYITDDITFEIADEVIRSFDKLELSKGPITIKMSSGGGSPEAALAIYDRIQQSKVKVIFIGYGVIMSAALIIMCCCTERNLYENTRLMWHRTSSEFHVHEITIEAMNIEVMEFKYINDVANKIISLHSNMSSDFWSSINNELYFSPEEAKKMGIIDNVICPVKTNVGNNCKPDLKFEKLLKERSINCS